MESSVFPPLLRSYQPELEADGKVSRPPSQWKATPGIRLLLERTRKDGRGEEHSQHPVQRRDRSLKQQRKKEGSPLERGAGQKVQKKMVSERDIELQRKRIKKAEATLRRWDLLQKEERDRRFSVLKQRVLMQRELIAKASKLSEELREIEDEKKLEEIESRKETRKEMVAALRSHIQRVEEHKRNISAKLLAVQTSARAEPDGQEYSSPRQQDGRGSPGELSEYTERSNGSSSGSDDDCPTKGNTQHTLLQHYGVDPLSAEVLGIETLWGRRKADVTRRLRPVALHSHQLKQVVSPSVRQCLELYEQPTARSRYTGEAIPLTDVLTSITRSKSVDPLERRRGFMARSAKRNQQRAQILLSKRDKAPNPDPGLYVQDSTDSQVDLKPKATLSSKRTEAKQVSKRSPNLKRKLPQLLTESGEVVATSLVEVGDSVYYRPTRDRGRQWHGTKGSTFLTELAYEDGGTLDLGTNGGRTTACRWQPLSQSALHEYSGVTAISVTEHIHDQGTQKLWRPLQATSF